VVAFNQCPTLCDAWLDIDGTRVGPST
jgi:hypothetical protein